MYVVALAGVLIYDGKQSHKWLNTGMIAIFSQQTMIVLAYCVLGLSYNENVVKVTGETTVNHLYSEMRGMLEQGTAEIYIEKGGLNKDVLVFDCCKFGTWERPFDSERMRLGCIRKGYYDEVAGHFVASIEIEEGRIWCGLKKWEFGEMAMFKDWLKEKAGERDVWVMVWLDKGLKVDECWTVLDYLFKVSEGRIGFMVNPMRS